MIQHGTLKSTYVSLVLFSSLSFECVCLCSRNASVLLYSGSKGTPLCQRLMLQPSILCPLAHFGAEFVAKCPVSNLEMLFTVEKQESTE